jgi:hypothetical protein
MSTDQDEIAAYVSYICLVYHEARNVRHLIRGRHLDPGPYRRLCESLATNRYQAWAQLQPLRMRAVQEGWGGAHLLFWAHFALSLEELEELYGDAHWKHASLGGNRWREVTHAVIELRDSQPPWGDSVEKARLLREIPLMHHNTGEVGNKLADLDSHLEH